VEIDTPPRTRLDDLLHDLRAWRTASAAAAEQDGAWIVAAGTSPAPAAPQPTRDERYERIIDRFGITAEDLLTCGCHVHVSVDGEEEGVAVLDRIRTWLPALLALSANSPFWSGRDSGYASFRSQSWIRWPSAGPTDIFGSAEAYRRVVDGMVASEVILDDGMVYFDARLSSTYPTVEIRATDVCLDPADAVLVAALCRGLVETAAREWATGRPPAEVPTALLRLAMWQAGKSGVDGLLLDPETHRPRAASEVLSSLVEHTRTALVDAGDLEQVEQGIGRVLSRGTGARRQREIRARTGSWREVVADLGRATAGR
jgi:carboxylate-amine ligase